MTKEIYKEERAPEANGLQIFRLIFSHFLQFSQKIPYIYKLR
jgi:hypothetical protein